MASGISRIDSSKVLNIKDLQYVLDVFKNCDFPDLKWFKLGLKLGLVYNTLTAIEKNHEKDVQRCMTECLAKWLQRADEVVKTGGGTPCLAILIGAVRAIDENGVADDIYYELHVNNNPSGQEKKNDDVMLSLGEVKASLEEVKLSLADIKSDLANNRVSKEEEMTPNTLASVSRATLFGKLYVERPEMKEKEVWTVKPLLDSFSVSCNANIAAIDFGSTYCSIAFTTSAEPDGEVNTLKLNEVYARVPTAILLKKESQQTIPGGVSCKIDSFGYYAQTKIQRLKYKKQDGYLYFERMKMQLQHDQKVDRSMTLPSEIPSASADHDTKWYLIEVIAFILQYLKDELLNNLSMNGIQLRAVDFEWVITVPAIWQVRGKQMMREAGYLAGLCGGNGIRHLSLSSHAVQLPPEDIDQAKLTLVPEPEAAALYCQRMNPKYVAKFCTATPEKGSFSADRYIVIDIGGGTVDITAQEVNRETKEVDVIQAPRGNDCGGMMVNRQFGRLFQKILGEKETAGYDLFSLENAFPKLLSKDSSLLSVLNFAIYNDFELQKEIFGQKYSKQTKEVAVKISEKNLIVTCGGISSIRENLERLKIEGRNNDEIELEGDYIYVKYTKVTELFQPAINGILSCTRKALQELSKKSQQITTIYLVGGFGGCEYVYTHIKKLLAEEFPQSNYSVIVPQNHKIAVANGAVLYKKSSYYQFSLS